MGVTLCGNRLHAEFLFLGEEEWPTARVSRQCKRDLYHGHWLFGKLRLLSAPRKQAQLLFLRCHTGNGHQQESKTDWNQSTMYRNPLRFALQLARRISFCAWRKLNSTMLQWSEKTALLERLCDNWVQRFDFVKMRMHWDVQSYTASTDVYTLYLLFSIFFFEIFKIWCLQN
jgi:hypothetical protein